MHASPEVLFDFNDPATRAQQFNDLIWSQYRERAEVLPNVGLDGTPGLRVYYQGSDVGSERVLGRVALPQPGIEMSLNFNVRFGEDWQFVLGGKIHGLGPANPITGGTAVPPDGWSSRAMFGGNGSVRSYVYHQDLPGVFGEGESSARPVFDTGVYHAVTIHTRLNDGSNAFNGFSHIYVDGVLVVEDNNLRFRETINSDTLIRNLMFSTFHGGNSPDWAPKLPNGDFATVYADFDNLRVDQGLFIASIPEPASVLALSLYPMILRRRCW